METQLLNKEVSHKALPLSVSSQGWSLSVVGPETVERTNLVFDHPQSTASLPTLAHEGLFSLPSDISDKE